MMQTAVSATLRLKSPSILIRNLSSSSSFWPWSRVEDIDENQLAPHSRPSAIDDAVRSAADAHISRQINNSELRGRTWIAEGCDDERPYDPSINQSDPLPGHVDARIAPQSSSSDVFDASFLPRRTVGASSVLRPSSLLDMNRKRPLRPIRCASWTDDHGNSINLLPLSDADPFRLTASSIAAMDESMADLVGSDHPILSRLASYFLEKNDSFEATSGKKIRPTMVLLLSSALHSSYPTLTLRSDLSLASLRLAEIAELIHTASLYHDDVIDRGEVRRGRPALHAVYGNKAAILAGDFLLARASICLARLRDCAVVECMSSVVEHLVRGEVMQFAASTNATSEENNNSDEVMAQYLHKNFYKTASLMANSCKSAALLGPYPDADVIRSYNYGKHAGLAFQLIDDVLDFNGTIGSVGKESHADLKSGLATAPVLYAAERHPILWDMIKRKFSVDGDIETAANMVSDSDGISRTLELAHMHMEAAVENAVAIGREGSGTDPNVYRDALVHLAYKMVDRRR